MKRPDVFLAVDDRLEELARVGVAVAGQLGQLLRRERIADQQHQDRGAVSQHALGIVQSAFLRVHGHEEQGDRVRQDQDVPAGRLVAVEGGILMHHHPTRQGHVHPGCRIAGIAQVDQLAPLDGAIRVEDFRPGRAAIGPNCRNGSNQEGKECNQEQEAHRLHGWPAFFPRAFASSSVRKRSNFQAPFSLVTSAKAGKLVKGCFCIGQGAESWMPSFQTCWGTLPEWVNLVNDFSLRRYLNCGGCFGLPPAEAT